MTIVSGIDSVKALKQADEYVDNLPTPDEVTKYMIENEKGELIVPDTEFTYPSGHKRYGFYMDATLLENIRNSLMKSVAAKWDAVFIVTGLEGSGKTVLTSTLLKFVDPTFPGEPLNDGTSRRKCDRIVFSPDQFLTAVDTAQPGQGIQVDEAVLEFMAGDASTALQKLLMKKMVTIRKKRLYIAFVIPSIFDIRKSMAIRRTVFLLHTYSPDRIERGSFKFYNYDNKRLLFIKGKAQDDQAAAPPNFIGSFTDTEGLFYDVNEYNKKKDEAIENLTLSKDKKNAPQTLQLFKTKGQRDLLLLFLYKMLEAHPDGEKDLQDLIDQYHKEKAETNQKKKMSAGKFTLWLKNRFGNHLGPSEPTVVTMLRNATEYSKMNVDSLMLDKELKHG